MNCNIVKREELAKIRKELKESGKKVVFTNGCFDILHAGHVDYLVKAKSLGDILVVGINSDSSMKHIKDNKRPIITEEERSFIVSNLKPVDFVTIFNEDTPYKLISEIVPDFLIKGSDWDIENIVGRDIVEANGGEVKTIDFVTDQSTSKIIKKIIKLYTS
ncbi:bifunctional protein HldE [bacterium BMS3Abin04]|nr:bifunctional protein HldE [bacterium BMS3Abin04]